MKTGPADVADKSELSRGDTAPRGPRLDAWWAGVLAITLAAAVLVLWKIGDKSFWLDEGYSYAFAQSDPAKLWSIISSSQANMGIYYVFLHAWLGLGDGEAVIRSLSAILLVATIPVLYQLGARLLYPAAALVACGLLAVNAFAVHYGQEARGYTLVLLLSTVSSLLFAAALEKPSTWKWVAYVLVSALAVYAHFFAAFVVIAQALAFAAANKRSLLRQAAFAFGSIALLVGPLVIFVLTNEGNQIGWIPDPTLKGLQRALMDVAGGGGVPLLAVYLAASGWGLFAAFRSLWNEPDGRWIFVLLAGWLLIPILGSFAVSFVKPLFVPRYLIVSLPALVLLAGLGVTSLPRRWLAVPAVVVIVGLAVGGLLDYYDAPSQDDWRGAAGFIEEFAESGDALIVIPPKVRKPLEYYLTRDGGGSTTLPAPVYPPQALGTFPISAPKPGQLHEYLADRAGNYERVWIVLSYGSAKARQRALKTITSTFPLIERRSFRHVDLLLFGRPEGL